MKLVRAHGPLGRILVAVAAALAALSAQPAEHSNLPAQPVGADDLLAVSVYGAPEYTRSVRVDASGAIRLPMLPEPVAIGGRMPPEIEAAIANALHRAGLLVHPVVTVTVLEYASRPVRVTGAVRRPASFQAYGRTTLLDALNRAEGVTAEAGEEILVTRRRPGADAQTVRIPVVALLDGADPELNLALSGGEEIHVTEAAKVFVVGNVRKPGAFLTSPRNRLTVLRAVALAEGLSPFARKQVFVYRRRGAGAPEEIKVELGQILARKAADVALEPNDVLYVPDHTSRRITTQALERAVGFGTATASGVLVLGSAR